MQPYQSRFTDQEWSLLVGLPESVLSAASAAETDTPRRTQAENEAGLEAISDGRVLGNKLVETIASVLIERLGADPELGEEPAVAIVPDDPWAYANETIARARAARALLTAKVGKGDVGAYCHWLVTVAERVIATANSGVGTERVTPAEFNFVHRLNVALED